MNFPCIQCGLCCRSLSNISLAAQYDSGNGTCKYLKENLCSIYKERPLICNVGKMYTVYFKNSMTEIQYIKKNLQSCISIAKSFGKEKTSEELLTIYNEIK
jgi:Fe-S-cluster containining protein